MVRRFDARLANGPDGAIAEDGHLVAAPDAVRDAAAATALGPFHALLEATGARRGFTIGTRDGSVAWWLAAMRAGHLLYLEVRDVAPTWDPAAPDGTLLGGAIFFRHGDRLDVRPLG